MSTLVVIGLIAFVILGLLAAIGGNGKQYERIGESWLEPEPPKRRDESAAQDGDELL